MKISISQYFALLSKYLRPQWRRVAVLVVIVLAGICLSLINPQILRYFIDSAGAHAPLQSLALAGVLYLVVAITGQLATVVESYIGENIGLVATNQMRADLTVHVLSLDPGFHNAHTPGELIERVDGDVATLGNFFSRFVVRVFANGLLLVGVLILLFDLDWRVGAVMTVFTSISFALLTSLNNVSSRRWRMVREATAQLFGFLEERISGVEDIRSNGGTAYVLRRFAAHSRKLLRMTIPAAIMGSASWQAGWLLFGIGTVTALAMGIMLYSTGAVTIGTIFLMYSYTEVLNRPIEQISRQMQDLQLASAGITRIRELFNTRSAIVEDVRATLTEGPLAVRFEDVLFGYDGEEPVIRHLSLSVDPGVRLGLLGRTGSGKTTLTRLMFRFFDPLSGAIRLNDIDLRHLATSDLRNHVAIVTQDIQLFHASVRDNLTFFDRSIPDARILQVLDELGLREWLQRLPKGLDSRLAPGGTGLSAGESQLLAFARVYLKNPGLVILDEASSRLDPATEHRLEQAIDRLLRGRTGIIIAHRLATVQRVDHIVILDSGACVESGPREQLARDPQSRFAQLMRTGLEEALA